MSKRLIRGYARNVLRDFPSHFGNFSIPFQSTLRYLTTRSRRRRSYRRHPFICWGGKRAKARPQYPPGMGTGGYETADLQLESRSRVHWRLLRFSRPSPRLLHRGGIEPMQFRLRELSQSYPPGSDQLSHVVVARRLVDESGKLVYQAPEFYLLRTSLGLYDLESTGLTLPQSDQVLT
jgi:hypothetical protein